MTKDLITYTKIKCKCLNCTLHFVLYAWQKPNYKASNLFCPSCGQNEGHFAVWTEEVEGHISQEVPGNAIPVN